MLGSVLASPLVRIYLSVFAVGRLSLVAAAPSSPMAHSLWFASVSQEKFPGSASNIEYAEDTSQDEALQRLLRNEVDVAFLNSEIMVSPLSFRLVVAFFDPLFLFLSFSPFLVLVLSSASGSTYRECGWFWRGSFVRAEAADSARHHLNRSRSAQGTPRSLNTCLLIARASCSQPIALLPLFTTSIAIVHSLLPTTAEPVRLFC